MCSRHPGSRIEKQDIAETGRSLNEELKKLASQDPSSGGATGFEEIDARLDTFEREMRAIAFEVPVAQLRATLPERVALDRRGVLDLLDLMLGAEIEGLGGTEERIAAIDYLITLLCTAGAGTDAGAHQDPVTLTPRLYGLCERSDIDYDSRLPEIEAEFFAAADMHEGDAREEMALRALRRRKAELGASFFAPRVLRATVVLRLRRPPATHRRRGPGFAELGLGPARTGGIQRLCFGVRDTGHSRACRGLEASRRRGSPGLCAIDRVAWCLDLAYPDKSERAALLSESVGLRGR